MNKYATICTIIAKIPSSSNYRASVYFIMEKNCIKPYIELDFRVGWPFREKSSFIFGPKYIFTKNEVSGSKTEEKVPYGYTLKQAHIFSIRNRKSVDMSPKFGWHFLRLGFFVYAVCEDDGSRAVAVYSHVKHRKFGNNFFIVLKFSCKFELLVFCILYEIYLLFIIVN